MQFTKYLRDGVRSGAITRSVRVWMHPHVRAGRRYRFEEGEIESEKELASPQEPDATLSEVDPEEDSEDAQEQVDISRTRH